MLLRLCIALNTFISFKGNSSGLNTISSYDCLLTIGANINVKLIAAAFLLIPNGVVFVIFHFGRLQFVNHPSNGKHVLVYEESCQPIGNKKKIYQLHSMTISNFYPH